MLILWCTIYITIEIGDAIEKLIVYTLTPIAIGLAAYLAYQIGLLAVTAMLIMAVLYSSNRGD